MQSMFEPRMSHSGVSFVRPIRPVQSQIIQCSAVENLCAQVLHSVSMLFEVSNDADVQYIYAHMKAGLGRLLFHMPILTGTLRKGDDGRFGVEISGPSDAGVSFHFSDMSHDRSFPTFTQLRDQGYPIADCDNDGLGELRPEPFPETTEGHPVFITKITRVRGGICWLASLSHLITDLAQGTALIVQWAKFTKESFEAGNMGGGAPIPRQLPMPDRKRLTPKTEGGILTSEEITMVNTSGAIPGYTILDPTDPERMLELLDGLLLKATLDDSTDPLHREEMMEHTSGIWRFRPTQLDALKKKIKAHANGAQMSRFDTVTAFIWQRFHLAKRGGKALDPSEPREATIVTAINVRDKLNPPLPQTYLGACVDIVRVGLDKKLLVPPESAEHKWQGLTGVAKAIRQFGSAWSEKLYMKMLSMSLRTPMSPGIVPSGPIDMLVTDHAFFGHVVGADWGGDLGRCAVFREPYVARDTPRGEVIIFPNQSNGDLDVLISAEKIVLKRLLADPEMIAACGNLFVRHNVVDALKADKQLKAKL